MRTLPAAAIGLVMGSVSGYIMLALLGSVFHWEMAGMYVFVFAGLAGAAAGGLSAVVCGRIEATLVQRAIVGACLGAAFGLVAGLWLVANSSARARGAPEGLAFWAVAVIVIAGGLAGFTGGLMAQTSRVNSAKARNDRQEVIP
jgi:hypothetical protein